jgi:beta-lactamase class A
MTESKVMRWRAGMALPFLVAAVVAVALLVPGPLGATASTTTASAPTAAGSAQIKVPTTPVGKQLEWLLGIASQLPLSTKEIKAHFDSLFLAQVSPSVLNTALESLGPPGSHVSLLGLSNLEARSLVALIQIGPSRYSTSLSVDSTGLIDGLLFKPAAASVSHSWSQIDKQVSSVAPEVSFLAAKLNGNGTCTPEQSISAQTPRPLASMFKLFVLGALANAIREHRTSWDHKLTVTAAIKVGGSGTLQNAPDGSTLTVEQTAVKMISISDNTAADMLENLVTRSAVEDQVRDWSSQASLDVPFLTVKELFALKYHDFPAMANHFLSLNASQRAEYLVSTVDKVPVSAEQSSSAPRDINSIEWFASADDLCRALAGLASLEREPGLSPLNEVLSTNNGGIGLSATSWPRIWFKGGSEPGVLTLGYLARDAGGQSFVVIVLSEDTTKPVQESAAIEIRALDAINGAFGLLH